MRPDASWSRTSKILARGTLNTLKVTPSTAGCAGKQGFEVLKPAGAGAEKHDPPAVCVLTAEGVLSSAVRVGVVGIARSVARPAESGSVLSTGKTRVKSSRARSHW